MRRATEAPRLGRFPQRYDAIGLLFSRSRRGGRAVLRQCGLGHGRLLISQGRVAQGTRRLPPFTDQANRTILSGYFPLLI